MVVCLPAAALNNYCTRIALPPRISFTRPGSPFCSRRASNIKIRTSREPLFCRAQVAQMQLPQLPPRLASFLQNNPLLALAITFALAWIVSNVAQMISNALASGKLEYKEYSTKTALTYIPEDSSDYRMALARTRQAVLTRNAINFMNAGNPARALVELRRALEENSRCREPIITSAWERKDLLELYRLFLINSEVPHNFSTLLQLREMLDLKGDEAELLEKQLLASGEMFSI